MLTTPPISVPTLHIRPEHGWLNDPNGVARIDGRWHVFYQLNPAEPRHRDIHWGHHSSADLVSWREHPIALRPRPGGLDQDGCWTGCLVDDDGVPTAVYTAVHGRPRDAVTVLARSDRSLEHWEQGESAVMGPVTDPRYAETRDPYLFTVAGHRWAALGTGAEGGRPAVLLWRCDDLQAWEPAGVLMDDAADVVREHAPGDIFECPNVFPLTDVADGRERWVLVVSWARIGGDRGVTAFLGDMTDGADGPVFIPESAALLDAAPAMYAPQVLLDGGRVLWWGWIQETDDDQARVDRDGWSGALTLPRELVLDEGRLSSRHVPEIEALAGEALELGAPIAVPTFAVDHEGDARIALMAPGGDELFAADLVGRGRAIIDGSIVETYDDGGVPRSLRAYATDGAIWTVTGEGVRVRCWGVPG